MADEMNVVLQFPSRLELLAKDIRADLTRATQGRQDWIEGTLDLAIKLREARDLFAGNTEFSAWLEQEQIEIMPHDRAALLGLGRRPERLRQLLETGESTSVQLIWREAKNDPAFHVANASKMKQALEVNDPPKPGSQREHLENRKRLANAPRERITPEKRKDIASLLKKSPNASLHAIADQCNVSRTAVWRVQKEMEQQAQGKPPKRQFPSMAEQQAIRNSRPAFDDRTREELGKPPLELANEQHPDYPKGWTYEMVHREKYGRIQIFTPTEKEQHDMMTRFMTTVMPGLAKLMQHNPPAAEDIGKLKQKDREWLFRDLDNYGRKAIELLQSYLDYQAAFKAAGGNG